MFMLQSALPTAERASFTQDSEVNPNHYSAPRNLRVLEKLCGEKWVRFPQKKKITDVSSHKSSTMTDDSYML